MPLSRTPEPPPPDPRLEAIEYHQMDHSGVNWQFVDDLLSGGHIGEQVVDLGCGPAQIPIEICRRSSDVMVMAIDGEIEMLELAKVDIDMAGLLERIMLQHADVDDMNDFEEGLADTVVSNSLIHHLDNPEVGFQVAHRLTRDGGRIFLRDLYRPDSSDQIEALVEQYAGRENAEAQQLFRQSFHASLTLDEVRSLVGGLGIDANCVQMSSDRHWTLDWRKPST